MANLLNGNSRDVTGRVQKNQKKKPHKAAKGNQGKAKMGYALVSAPPFAPKSKNRPTPKKDNPAKDAICHQCGEVGHWRRNCPVYLAELLKKKKLSQGASTSGIFTIELYSFPSTSWVYDTGYGTHICITTQGLKGSRKLKLKALSLYVGDGNRAAVEAIEEFHLCLPISRNNLVYFSAIPRDDIYEIDLSSSNTNDSSMYAISNKRAKLNLDSTLLWHCRLGHINKKRIEKLQHDGLLDSIDIKSVKKCASCMSGKLARKPYSHQVERAKDLLGLIHTDERENQLRKTIKSLRSDRGGEYMSQEFLDHLKEHGIIAHRTPPYTPQHNGVLERRNRTLLDMVRSIMSQTTLPKSFWDYALESTTRILNMVPTKKVEKTPYEVWHGQA
ncbi:retrotransposon protein, putative, ty1-copia subclass [Tanacetum coccineum]